MSFTFIPNEEQKDCIDKVNKFILEQTYFSQIQFQRPINFQTFVETMDSVLAGYQIQVTIDLINPWVTDGDFV